MKELMNVKFFNNEIILIQTDGGTYKVTERIIDNDGKVTLERTFKYENMEKAFSRYIHIITEHLMSILDLLHAELLVENNG